MQQQWSIKTEQGYVIGVWAARAEEALLPSGLTFAKLYDENGVMQKMVEGTLVQEPGALSPSDVEGNDDILSLIDQVYVLMNGEGITTFALQAVTDL